MNPPPGAVVDGTLAAAAHMKRLEKENHDLRRTAYGGCTCGCEDFHECGKD
jgi:hypothetical protein